jgi:transglutaminase-like putative cysteine protease
MAPAALLGSPPPAPEPPASAEHWYTLAVNGTPAGWAREGWRTTDAGVVSDSALRLRVRRGGSELTIEIEGRFVETADGRPVRLWTRRLLGTSPVEATYELGPDGVDATTRQGGRERRERLSLPEGDWLTPAAARRAVAAHQRAGDHRYTVRSIDPAEGLEPKTVTRTWLGPPSPEARAAGATGRWREEDSDAPGVASTVALDADGDLVRSTLPFLGLEMTLQLTDRESALAAAGTAPELLTATFVRPDRPIEDPRSVRRGVYRLVLPDGVVPDLPTGGAQRAARRGRAVEVRVTSPEGGAPGRAEGGAGGGEPAADQDGEPPAGTLEPSLYLDFRDPAVAALATRARQMAAARAPGDGDRPGRPTGPAEPAGSDGADEPEESRRALAEDLSRFVHGYVRTKDYDTGFATASEVVATRSGDCTEHSVLLAALLRAEGIPSRVVTGLVYLDRTAGAAGVFGYHMWVEAWIDGRWLDLDPTIPSPRAGGFDATHVALAVSTLDGPDAGGSLDRLLPLFGKLRIEVVEAR